MPVSRVSLVISTLATGLSIASLAEAQYAVPPDSAWERDSAPETPPTSREASSVVSLARLGVGPALRVSESQAFAGLATSLDLGRSSGLRFQGAWTELGGEGGEQHYGADLWLFLGPLGRLQPFVGAGAALVRTQTALGFHDHGVATVRATLDYVLPLADSDARFGVDAYLNVPAIDAAERSPSALFVSRLGLGL